jgi:hypothetical protein
MGFGVVVGVAFILKKQPKGPGWLDCWGFHEASKREVNRTWKLKLESSGSGQGLGDFTIAGSGGCGRCILIS